MNETLPETAVLSLREIYSDRPDARLDRVRPGDAERLNARIRGASPNSIVVFDLHGLQYLGYSFSKHTLRKALKARNDGAFGERRIMMVTEMDEVFLEGLNDALEQGHILVYVAPNMESLGSTGTLIGAKSEPLRETFQVLLAQAPVSTGTVANALHITPQNAKNRLDRLANMGLIVREKVASETGGHEWINSVL